MEILLVEDDDDHAHLERRALEVNEDWHVHRVSTCSDAQALVDDVDLHLAVIDHRLPDGDGLSLLKHIRARAPNLPVLFVTGQGSEDIALEAIRHGAVDYLTKGPDLGDRLATRADEVLTGWPGDGPLVQVTQDEASGNDRPERPRSRSGDLDQAALEAEIGAVVEDPVLGALVVDRRGRTLAEQLPDGLGDQPLARVLKHVHEAIGELRKDDALTPRRYAAVVETKEHVLAFSAAPGPMLVALLLRSSAGSMIALRRAQEAARRVWEAA